MYLENRLIAMLDVLGFSNYIQERTQLEQTTKKYAELINQAKTKVFFPEAVPGSPNKPLPNFEYSQFVFDTVVLVSYPTDRKAVCRFILATIQLMEMFFTEKFPLRGSIGIGDFCMDETVPIFLSDTFKRLQTDEKNQEWAGCILLPEAEELVIQSILGQPLPPTMARSAPLFRTAVPFKVPNSPTERWCLNWAHFLSSAVIDTGIQYMAKNPQKQRNTVLYLESLNKLFNDTQTLPEQFSPAKKMKVMKARAATRVKFEDLNGNGVEPGCDWTLTAYENNV